MVAIGNKSNLDGNLSILKPKSSQDNVDMLFAELFSLINFNEENEPIWLPGRPKARGGRKRLPGPWPFHLMPS